MQDTHERDLRAGLSSCRGPPAHRALLPARHDAAEAVLLTGCCCPAGASGAECAAERGGHRPCTQIRLQLPAAGYQLGRGHDATAEHGGGPGQHGAGRAPALLLHQPGRGAAAAVQVPKQPLLQVKAPPEATPALAHLPLLKQAAWQAHLQSCSASIFGHTHSQ